MSLEVAIGCHGAMFQAGTVRYKEILTYLSWKNIAAEEEYQHSVERQSSENVKIALLNDIVRQSTKNSGRSKLMGSYWQK